MRDLILVSAHSHHLHVQILGNYKHIVLRKYNVKNSHFKPVHKTRKTTVKYTIMTHA